MPPSSWLRASSSRVERPERILPQVGRNARPVVVDMDGQGAAVVDARDRHAVGVALRIGDEIAEAAAEGVGPHDRLGRP